MEELKVTIMKIGFKNPEDSQSITVTENKILWLHAKPITLAPTGNNSIVIFFKNMPKIDLTSDSEFIHVR